MNEEVKNKNEEVKNKNESKRITNDDIKRYWKVFKEFIITFRYPIIFIIGFISGAIIF